MCKLVEIKNNIGDNILVADNKVNCIKNIIESACICKNISRIILFGSAVSTRCTDKSDIDIAIISDIGMERLYKLKSFKRFLNAVYSADYNQEYDRLYFKSLEQIERNIGKAEICSEILKNGVTIYKRSL